MKKNKTTPVIASKDKRNDTAVTPVGTKKATEEITTARIPYFNKDAIIFSGIAFVIFLIIRFFFPIPDLIPDSRGYILGAITDSDIGYRPMGICVLLKKVHDIDPSITAVAYTQFLLNLASALTLAHAFIVNFKFSATGRKILYGILLLNPTLLHLCNAVFADSLFISLNILWVAFFLYLVKKSSYLFLGALLLSMWMSMFVRYNALAYPFVVIIGLLFISNKMIKWVGIAGCIIVSVVFYTIITNRMEEATDYKVLSGFSGWQMATNAITFYKISPHEPLKTDDPQLQKIDQASRKYIDSMIKADPAYRTALPLDFLWGVNAPFKKFEAELRIKNQTPDVFKNWIATSLILNKYGVALIKQYPVDFVLHYLVPNTGAYFFPDLELVGTYTAGETQMFPQIKDWYNLPNHISSNNKDLPAIYNRPVQILYILLSFGFPIMFIIWMMNMKKWQMPANAVKVICVVFIFWVCKTGFDILAAPSNFRYVVVLVPILSGGLLMLIEQYRNIKAAGPKDMPDNMS